jgi:SAM-dependent methyltransferase
MKRISLLETAHAIVARYVHLGDAAIDATLGNGHDTLFLAGRVGRQGRVFGFDIQASAVANTRQRLLAAGAERQVSLFQASHADMVNCIAKDMHGLIKAVMFNLGYLPGGDKSVVTHVETTLQALEAACSLLADAGVVTILAYPGHPGGDVEAQVISVWCQELALQRQYAVETIESSHHQLSAPRLFVIRKKSVLLNPKHHS